MTSLFQFSIRSLLVAVTIAAVGIAALLNANLWWEAAIWLVALGLLGVGILLGIYRQGQQRAYWLGLVIFGGIYLGLISFASLSDTYYELAPSQALHLAYKGVIPESRQSEYTQAPGTGAPWPVVSYAYQPVNVVPSGVNVVPSGAYAPPIVTPPPASGTMPMLMQSPVSNLVLNADYVPLPKFISIGHAMWLLLAAAIGGKICQWVFRTQSPREPQPSTPAEA